jgi:hypothetical protein
MTKKKPIHETDEMIEEVAPPETTPPDEEPPDEEPIPEPVQEWEGFHVGQFVRIMRLRAPLNLIGGRTSNDIAFVSENPRYAEPPYYFLTGTIEELIPGEQPEALVSMNGILMTHELRDLGIIDE